METTTWNQFKYEIQGGDSRQTVRSHIMPTFNGWGQGMRGGERKKMQTERQKNQENLLSQKPREK